VLASKKLDNPDFPAPKVRTPVLLACDAADEKAYMEERFGPISFIVKVADTAAPSRCPSVWWHPRRAHRGVYSTRPKSSTR
jgi:hypothetical protein